MNLSLRACVSNNPICYPRLQSAAIWKYLLASLEHFSFISPWCAAPSFNDSLTFLSPQHYPPFYWEKLAGTVVTSQAFLFFIPSPPLPQSKFVFTCGSRCWQMRILSFTNDNCHMTEERNGVKQKARTSSRAGLPIRDATHLK